MTKYVYLFREGNATMKNLLGGKGANLAEMTSLGMPVPQGFTVTTEACNNYYNNKKVITEDIKQQIFAALEVTEKEAGKKFGDPKNTILSFCSFRFKSFNARDDGYDSKPWT